MAMKKFLGIVTWIIIASIAFASLYNKSIHRILPISEGLYEWDNGTQRTFTQFTGNNAMLYVFVNEDNSVRYGAKYVFKAYSQGYNHLVGDLYFTGETLLSLRSVKDGENRGTLELDTKSVTGYDFRAQNTFEPTKDAYQGIWMLGVFPDHIDLSGQCGEKIESFPKEYIPLIEIMDSLD